MISHLAAAFTDTSAQLDQTSARLAIRLATTLTILCWIFLALFLISRINKDLRNKFEDALGDKVFFLVWLVPTTAMVMSLYFSEFLGWAPCTMCWYQRAFMYSLSLLMLVYWFKRAKTIRVIGYALAATGPIISIYHIGLEKLWWTEVTKCTTIVSCDSPWFTQFGFLTTAGMALTAFVTIVVLLYLTSRYQRSSAAINSASVPADQ